MDKNILIGGSAGQGIDTLASIIEKLLQSEGYNIFSTKDYMSRIRGGHNFSKIRFSNKKVSCHKTILDILIAFDEESIEDNIDNINNGGIIFTNEEIASKYKDSKVKDYIQIIDTKDILKEIGNRKVLPTIFLGALVKYLSIDIENVKETLKKFFNEKILEVNIKTLEKAYNIDVKSIELEKGINKNKILINSNEALGFGSIASGVKFYSAYPMTPSTSIMNFITKYKHKFNIVVEQAEDEIAAVNMVLGSNFAGTRGLTATSGGGLSLMTETLSLIGVSETPFVLINVQRPGPATGFPTRTEQSDLSFAINGSHGEFPRIVTSIKSSEEAFYKISQAFNISEKYQVLVIVLNDQYLADAKETIEPYDFDKISIERHICNEEVKDYKRYEFTDTGVSKRIIPGKLKNNTVLGDCHIHDEYGNISELASMKIDMMKKFDRKIELFQENDIEEPDYFGVEKPKDLFITWGSNHGLIKEGIEELNKLGYEVGALSFSDVFPLPTKILKEKLKYSDGYINVEHNYNSQFAKVINDEISLKPKKSILKYDGRQLTLEEFIESAKEVLTNE